MHKQRMALRMIKDVIRLKWEAQLSHEQIAVALGVSKGAVTKYVGLANAAGLDWDVVRDWDERQLVARLLPRAPADPSGATANREHLPARVPRRLRLGGTMTADNLLARLERVAGMLEPGR